MIGASMSTPGLLPAALLAALLSLTPIAGCDSTGGNLGGAESDRAISSDNGQAAGKEEPRQVQLNWIGHWKGEGKREDLVREVKREYEFLHPDVKINMVFNSDLEGDEPNRKVKAADAIVKMIETGETDWDLVFLMPPHTGWYRNAWEIRSGRRSTWSTSPGFPVFRNRRKTLSSMTPGTGRRWAGY